MPRIINALADGNDSLTSSLGGLATSIFGDQAKRELVRQHALKVLRENENVPLYADAAARGDTPATVRTSILAGREQHAPQMNLLAKTGLATGINDPSISVASVGAGHSAAGTPWGVNQSEANRVKIENLRTKRQYDAAVYNPDTTPVNVIDANGRPVIASRSTAVGQQPVLGESDVKGTIAGNAMLPRGIPRGHSDNFGGEIIAATEDNAIPIAPSSRISDSFGQLSPTQSKYIGIDKPTQPYIYRTPDGRTGTTLDSKTDAITGQPLTAGVIVGTLQAQNTDALGSNHAAQGALLESRIANKNAIAQIGGLRASLLKPNADQAVGYIGTVARMFNDTRAQVEAGARLLNPQLEPAAAAFSSAETQHLVESAVNTVFGNPQIAQRAAQLGVDHAVLKSQIQDLSYMIAKTQNPHGNISNQDVANAGRTVGAMLMDPKAGVQVLNQLEQRLTQNQAIREQETSRMFGAGVGQPQQPAAPQQAAPPTPTQPDAVPVQTERWERGPDGRPMRVQ